MTNEDGISVSRLAGQLAYLFDDHPELRNAAPSALADQLNHQDRFARARERYPLATDAEIADKVAEFEARITADDVSEALRHLPG
jgi:transposase